MPSWNTSWLQEAVGAMLVFDVTRASTFDAVTKWKNDLDTKVQLANGSPVPCVLLGNKCDAEQEDLVQNANQMDEFCREKGFLGWYETSAKENIGIEESARKLVEKVRKRCCCLYSIFENHMSVGPGKRRGSK